MLDSTPVNNPQSGAGETPLTRDQALTRLAISDYVMLTKPRIISLLLVITLLPMFLAGPEAPSGWLILWTMVGGFLACLLYTSAAADERSGVELGGRRLI